MKKIENYLLQEKLGEGQFGQVFKAKHAKSKKLFAIKVISKALYNENPSLQRLLRNEIKIMKESKNDNLLRLYESFETTRNYYLVLDLCEDGDLEAFMIKRKVSHFSEMEAIVILRQISKGLKEMRERKIMHRDLKLANIFIKGRKVVLGDFGTAKIVENMTNTMVGTPLNMAPEVLKGNEYNSKSDLWSIGVVFYQLLTGSPPFFAFSKPELLTHILKQAGKNLRFMNKTHFCSETKGLLRRMLEPDPGVRISWEDFFSHALFSHRHKNQCRCIRNNMENSFIMRFGESLVQKPTKSNISKLYIYESFMDIYWR